MGAADECRRSGFIVTSRYSARSGTQSNHSLTTVSRKIERCTKVESIADDCSRRHLDDEANSEKTAKQEEGGKQEDGRSKVSEIDVPGIAVGSRRFSDSQVIG
jgi:hypothetical protein